MIEIIPNWHPIFVHFTVALLSLAVGLEIVTLFVKPSLQEQWRIVARWALWFGVAITIITGLTGLYAYNTVDHDTPSHAAMTEHRNWAAITITAFLSLAAWSIVAVKKNRKSGMAFVISMVAAGALLLSTAWHGGELVYRYGLGVMSLPKVEGEGHDHSHGETGHADAPGMEQAHQPHEAGHDHDEMDLNGMETDMEEHDDHDHEH